MKVKIRRLLKCFILVSLIKATCLQALSNQELERISTFIRVPVVIGANVMSSSNGPTKLKQGMLIAADLVRLCSEVLSIINKQGRYDFHYHDYCWVAYDGVNLIYHLRHLKKILIEDSNRIDEDEYQLRGLSKILHEWVLPCVEGITAFLAANCDKSDLEDARLSSKYKTINSVSRLLDGIIMSKPWDKERYVYICLLVIVILLWINDDQWFDNKKREVIREKERRMRGQVEDIWGQEVRIREEILRQAWRERERQEREELRRNIERRMQELMQEMERRRQALRQAESPPVDPERVFFVGGACAVCLNHDFEVNEQVRRLTCGHVPCCNACVTDLRLNACPICRIPRNGEGERNIHITQEMLDQLNENN